MKIKTFSPVICCPTCWRQIYNTNSHSFSCINCQKVFPFIGNKLAFENAKSDSTDELDRLKRFLKSFPKFYAFLAEVIAPLHLSKRKLKMHVSECEQKNELGINLGSGITDYSDRILNIDFQDSELGTFRSGFNFRPEHYTEYYDNDCLKQMKKAIDFEFSEFGYTYS